MATNHLVRKIKTFGEADNGNVIGIEFVDHNQTDRVLMVPRELEGEFLASFQAAAITASQARGEKPSSDVISALDVDNVKFGVADDQSIAVTLELKTGLELNLAFGPGELKKLRNSLDALDQFRRAGGVLRAQ